MQFFEIHFWLIFCTLAALQLDCQLFGICLPN